MKCREIISRLEEMSPPEFAEQWDNSGLQVGDIDKQVHSVMVALDATYDVVEEAANRNVDMLITHHPLIFKPVSNIFYDDFIGKRIVSLIKNDIILYSMHTNFDVIGMADAAADMINLKNTEVLSVTYEDDISKEGIGRYGTFENSMSLLNCAEFVKNRLRIENVTVFGDLNTKITTAAISTGSCKSVLKDAVRVGVDLLISADVDHHSGLDMLEHGICVIDAGHYNTEKLFINYIKDFFTQRMPYIDVIPLEVGAPYEIL